MIPDIKVPEKRVGETTAEYIDRLEWERNRLPAEVRDAPVYGHVATAKGFIPWYESWRIGTETGGRLNPAHVKQVDVEATFGKQEQHRKRSPQERLEQMTRMLIEDAERTYQKTGQVHFASSILRRISELTGMPEKTIEAMTVTQLREVYARLAGDMLRKAERHGFKGDRSRPAEIRTATA